MVDTGLERTFVREDMVDAHDLSEATQLLCGVTGECTTMKGPVSINVGVVDVMERLPVFIADLENPCLLGLDYLTRVRACVDLRGGNIRVRSQGVPLILEGDARDVRDDKSGYVTYEATEEARCMRARTEHPASTPDHSAPVTSTAVVPR